MKNLLTCVITLLIMASCSNPNEVSKSFLVYGNCMMCEETIEGVFKENNTIVLADWDRHTKQFNVTYDSTLTSLSSIKQNIASVGYDTENYRANKSTYDSLHICCKYKRPEPLID